MGVIIGVRAIVIPSTVKKAENALRERNRQRCLGCTRRVNGRGP